MKLPKLKNIETVDTQAKERKTSEKTQAKHDCCPKRLRQIF